MILEKKIKYQQPHNIKIYTGNPALDYHLINKEHIRQKYESKKKES